jgi:hypothetical protein
VPRLNYRLQGHNDAAIGKHLGVTANAVQKDVVKALWDFVKPETADAVLAMELTRLDSMQAAVYAEAINGDTGAIDTCLKIMNQRQRLLNLVPGHKPPVFNLSFGGGTDMPNAEEVGIRARLLDLPSREQYNAHKIHLYGERWCSRRFPETSCRSLGNLLEYGRSQPR